jgi:hypothetical protein
MADRPDGDCLCVETSPAPDAFDGIFHWRSDCPYLNDIERTMVTQLYGKPRGALARWHAAAIIAAENAAFERAAIEVAPYGWRIAEAIRALKHPQADAETGK